MTDVDYDVNKYLSPEAKARLIIDQKLSASGWIIQDLKGVDLSTGMGVAIREYPTDTGRADYILFVNREPVGIIEAKEDAVGEKITDAEGQTARYAAAKLKRIKDHRILPFGYEATGIITRYTDRRDPKPRSREVFTFHRPETLQEYLRHEASLRKRLQGLPKLNEEGLYGCQVKAIKNLDISFRENRPRALIQMASGSGKTFTAITFSYRLLKFAHAKRILFLVDTKNLGEQAEQEFQRYTPADDPRKFHEIYNVQRLKSQFIDKNSQVCISTIQRMYSILKGEPLDESAEEVSMFEIREHGDPKEVVYNDNVPIETFDFIIIDECHRSIYNLWKQVLEYFDAFQVGLTATPDKRTFGYFKRNVVSEYSHNEAVIDGVNVGYDEYEIETEITKEGGILRRGLYVDIRNRMTREKRWEQLDEDYDYDGRQLDRDVVSKDQIRLIIRTFRHMIKNEIFPLRKEIPKTLIFAKTDSHADDIIQIVREEFAEGNEFCKKVTYRTEGEKPKEVLQNFRNDFNPRIAVTVDMIATGTDVKPLECLLFIRDVKSRNYFEQMKGRGARTLDKDSLQKVSESAVTKKTHFVVVDAVGVLRSIKTDSIPWERKPYVSMKDLMLNVAMGDRSEDTFLSLANRLTRLEAQLSDYESEKFHKLAGGKTVQQVVQDLVTAHNPDIIEAEARAMFNLPEDAEPTVEQLKEAEKQTTDRAARVFDSPDLRDFIEDVRKNYDQVIDNINVDRLISAGPSAQVRENAAGMIRDFQAFIEKNKDEIAALQFFYSQPYRRKGLTFKMIKELHQAMARPPYNFNTGRLWQAYERTGEVKVRGGNVKRMLTDIISILRLEAGLDEELAPFSDAVNYRFREWVFKKNATEPKPFTDEQMEWLRMIRDHIVTSVFIEPDDFDNTPFAEKGGLIKVHHLFGKQLNTIIDEINEALAA